MTGALPWFLALFLMSRWGRSSTPSPAAPPATPTANPPRGVYASTPPWPQVPARDLPKFPGAGWVPDVPVGPGVAARASALLKTLWARGEGASVVEQTAGRWIAYQAAMTAGKRGVVAYRHVQDEATPVSVEPVTVVTDVPVGPPTVVNVATSAPKTALRTLRRGSKGDDVRAVQAIVGVKQDGDFGPATDTAVRAWQSAHGLNPDGAVGPKTYTAMFGGQNV